MGPTAPSAWPPRPTRSAGPPAPPRPTRWSRPTRWPRWPTAGGPCGTWPSHRAPAAWRAGRFELPDYYLVTARGTAGTSAAGVPGATADPPPADPSSQLEQDFYLGPLRAARPHRV